jgi:dihydrofolate reductase
MRKVIASEFVSLDGVIENPVWTFRFTGEEQQRFKYDELSAADALLLGRVTYEGFAGAWPHMTEQAGEYADMMNGYPKYVVSTTLEEPLGWNNSTLIKGDVAEEVSELKRQPGGDILVFGSGSLVNELMRLGFIDEYRLMVFPVVVGIQPVIHDPMEEDLRPALAVAVGPLLGGEPHVVLRAAEGVVEPFGLPAGYGVGRVVAHECGALYLIYQPLEGVLALHEEELLEGLGPVGPHPGGDEEAPGVPFCHLLEEGVHCRVVS